MLARTCLVGSSQGMPVGLVGSPGACVGDGYCVFQPAKRLARVHSCAGSLSNLGEGRCRICRKQVAGVGVVVACNL